VPTADVGELANLRLLKCAMRSRSSTSPDHDTVIIPPKYPPIRFGDYALWFARESY